MTVAIGPSDHLDAITRHYSRMPARDGNDAHQTLLTVVANTALARMFALDQTAAEALLTHAIEEMGYLSDLLPALYERERGGA